MHRSLPPRALRIFISGSLTGLLVFAFSHFPILNVTTVALILVVNIVCLSLLGEAEALAGAIVAGLGLDYFYFPPGGFDRPDEILSFLAFMITAVGLAHFHRQADGRREEFRKSLRLANVILVSDDAGSMLDRLPEHIAGIYGATAVAIYDTASGHIFGSASDAISRRKLRDVALGGEPLIRAGSFILPIRDRHELRGSIGIRAKGLSEEAAEQVADRVGLVLAGADALEREIATEAARRSDELKSSLLDAVMHEIKSPLSSLNMAASILLSARCSAAEQKEILGMIQGEVARLNHRIDDATRIARIEAGDFWLEKEPHPVSAIVRGSLEEMAVALHGRRVESQIPDTLPLAECDNEMVKHVLKLLLDNAVKYSPQDTPIGITGRQEDHHIVVGVASGGPAIAEDERERLFERYYRGSESRSLHVAGTGLGLASAKSIVEAHGGRIWVTSQPGKNIFSFLLPIAPYALRHGVDSFEALGGGDAVEKRTAS